MLQENKFYLKHKNFVVLSFFWGRPCRLRGPASEFGSRSADPFGYRSAKLVATMKKIYGIETCGL
jgi:hypothetical protein